MVKKIILKGLLLLLFPTIGLCDSLSNVLEVSVNRREKDNRTKKLLLLLDSLAVKDEFKKLKEVNDFFNTNIEYKSDLEVWNKNDYWATPKELLAKGAGDCEDFVIAKYYTLINLGLTKNKLRLGYVYYINGSNTQRHMVLYYLNNNQKLILDNINLEIVDGEGRKDLSPIFSFNELGLYLGVGERELNIFLSRWEDLKYRVGKEYINDLN